MISFRAIAVFCALVFFLVGGVAAFGLAFAYWDAAYLWPGRWTVAIRGVVFWLSVFLCATVVPLVPLMWESEK